MQQNAQDDHDHNREQHQVPIAAFHKRPQEMAVIVFKQDEDYGIDNKYHHDGDEHLSAFG
jgi:hypothetical protein